MQSYNRLATLEDLQERDYTVFYPTFRKIIQKKIPAFKDLFFIHNTEQAAKQLNSVTVVEKIEGFYGGKQLGQSFFCVVDQHIILSLSGKRSVTLAVLSEVDAYIARKVSLDWLKEIASDFADQFVQVKKAGTNLATGLYNDKQFYATLAYLNDHGKGSIMLIELFPSAKSAIEAKLHTARAVRSLNEYLEDRLPLFYLGNHLFAIISANYPLENFKDFGQRLFLILRKERFRKVHIGLAYSSARNESVKNTAGPYDTVDNAFTALQTANKRGPFSLCDFEHLRHPEKHPLRRSKISLLGRLRYAWKFLDEFSLVQLEPENPTDYQRINNIFKQQKTFSDEDDFYLLLPNITPADAIGLVSRKLKKAGFKNVKVGVGYYPHVTFTKSNVPHNCRKALQHAAFFGPAGTAIVDEVSFNVSGDIYYAEGDIRSAIKEYKIGLQCDENNINLLNSLGVAYTDMTQHHRAKACFSRVLELDSGNFMALYNSGLGADQKGDTTSALQFFERAAQVIKEHPEVQDELQLRLGKLYTVTGRYEKAIDTLHNLQQGCTDPKTKGRSLAYLGCSYYGCGRNNEAMTWLQRALQYNEFDANSMGLLGLVYSENGEGDDIALSLCHKSVELDPDNKFLKLYLAKAMVAAEDYASARGVLKKCLQVKTLKDDVKLLMARCYLREKLPKRAEFWLDKLKKKDDLDKNLVKQVNTLYEELNEI